MSERGLWAVIGALVALVLGLAFFWQPDLGARLSPAASLPAGGDFTFGSADGPVSLADYRGKLVLVYFGYTYCPDICPTSLMATAEGLKRLSPEELARVKTIFISVDPERDTLVRLKEYAEFFHPSIVGVTGSAQALAEAARRYGVIYARQQVDTAGGYVVDHTAETLLVDPAGKLVARMPHATPPEEVAALIRKYLKPKEGSSQ